MSMGLAARLFADCQECDPTANCYSDPFSDWCKCSTKTVGGDSICMVSEPGCQDPDLGCGGAVTLGPARLHPVDALAFAGFEEREPLLAGLLTAAIRQDAEGRLFLAALPVMQGTIAGAHGTYKYHGAFFVRANGQVGFIVDLDGLNRSNLVYSGVISSGGLHVSYTRTSRASADARSESERAEWTAPR